jgi:pyruvate dehydrogenase E2 component (dihydrolipoamide acetyltransferase)
VSELIRVPDIGNGEGEVIELMVKAGDRIEADQSLLTLESDKASMEIPAPAAGVIKRLMVKLGDKLKTGDDLLELELEDAGTGKTASPQPAAAPAPTPAAAPIAAPAKASVSAIQEIRVPDIGSSGKAKIIELMIKVGDHIEADQSLLTLESDKASMEIPSPAAGTVIALKVKLNDEVGTGDLIMQLQISAPAASETAPAAPQSSAVEAPISAAAPAAAPAPAPAAAGPPAATAGSAAAAAGATTI